MKFFELKYHILYSAVTILVILVLFSAASILFLEPLFLVGSTSFWIAYMLLGVSVILLFNPIRDTIKRMVAKLIKHRRVHYRTLENELVSQLVQQTSVHDASLAISQTLQKHFQLTDVQCVVSSQGRCSIIQKNHDIPVHNEDLLLRYFSIHPMKPLYRSDWSDIGDRQLRQELTAYFATRQIVLALPLSIGKKLWGWVTLHSSSVRYRLFQKELVFLLQLQPLLSVGMQRMMMDEELQKSIDEFVALHHVSQTMNSSLNVKETLESIMDAIFSLTRVDRVRMYLLNQEQTHVEPAVGRGTTAESFQPMEVHGEHSLFQLLARSREPIVMRDLEHDQHLSKEYATHLHSNSFVVVPMISKEQIIGMIVVDQFYSKRPIEEIKVELLVTLANHAAIALTNSRLHEQTQRFNEQLQVRVREATEHLERLLEMKSHFISVASHQLRTPTTVIRGLLSMIREDADLSSDELRSFIEQIWTASNRLQHIISDLLTSMEFEDHSPRLQYTDVDIAELLAEVLGHLAPIAESLGLQMLSHIPENLSQLRTDRFKLQEAIMNIVDNAIRYTPQGTVEVRVLAQEQQIIIEVHDSGIGLTAEEQHIIFERFRRGEQGMQLQPNGTGLGLYIAKNIIESLGGSIRVCSDGPQKGSTFFVRLPMQSDVVSSI